MSDGRLADIADQALAAIDARWQDEVYSPACAAHTERIRAAVAGLRKHSQQSAVGLADGAWCPCGNAEPCPDARLWADDLLRVAARYGVHATPRPTPQTAEEGEQG